MKTIKMQTNQLDPNQPDTTCIECGKNHSVVLGAQTFHTGIMESNGTLCSICAAKNEPVTYMSGMLLGLTKEQHQAILDSDFELVYN